MWPTKYEITAILVEELIGKGKKMEDLQESWFTKHLIIALREAIWVLLLIVKSVYENLTVRTASGSHLDDKGYDFGVDRKEAAKAVHTVTLHKSSAVSYDVYVPDGFLLSTTAAGNRAPVKFVVAPGQNKCILKGSKSVTGVFVECLELGEAGNVPNGAINLVAQSGFDYVTDSRLYSSGVKQEGDAAYRMRILERKRNPARAGVPSDWERWALEVQGVSAARCFRCARGPGTADVVLWGENGGLPSKGVLEACQKYFEEKYMPADLADGGILVWAPEPVTINIVITKAVLKNGYTAEIAVPILQSAFEALFQNSKAAKSLTVVDCIVCIRTAFDPSDAERSPIFQDFILQQPDSNLAMTGRQSLEIGEIKIEVMENE